MNKSGRIDSVGLQKVTGKGSEDSSLSARNDRIFGGKGGNEMAIR